MLGIIAKLKNMMSHLVEAKLLIESRCPRIVFPDAEPNLISIASHRGSEHSGHECLSDAFSVPLLIHINALDFRWPRGQYARRRVSPSKLGVTNECDIVVAYESLDLGIGDFGCLNGLAIGVRTMSVHILSRIQ